MKKIVLWIVLLFVMTNLSLAADQNLDRQQIYELRKDCGKSAAEYAYKWRLCEGTSTYQSHYNIKRNICFVYTIAQCKKEGDDNSFLAESLYDVNENKSYAAYFGSAKLILHDTPYCYVEHTKCKDLSAFHNLIEQYLKE